MSDLDIELTTEQTEKVLQYQDLTGIEDFSVCRDTLIRHHWDLEAAVQDQLNMREGRPSVFTAPTRDPPITVSDARNQQVYVPATPSVPWSWRYGGPFGFAASLIFRMLYDTFTSVVKFFYNLFRQPPTYPLDDPVGDVMNHIAEFERALGRAHPVFYRGTYGQALADCKQELKFLLVHLHSIEVPESHEFSRKTLTNEEVIQYINSHSILFWSCKIESGEGQRVMKSVNATTFPFIGVIIPRGTKMVIVARFHGNITPSGFLSKLREVIQGSMPLIDAARVERMERALNQSLRMQQDAAYMASLLEDQEKQRRHMEREQERRRIVEEEERMIEMEKQRQLSLIMRKKEYGARVPKEPPAEDGALCLLFKFPDGTRVERRFLPTHTLKDIYYFVFSKPELSDNIEISTSFPKRVLPCTSSSELTLQEIGLSNKEVLLIYDLDS